VVAKGKETKGMRKWRGFLAAFRGKGGCAQIVWETSRLYPVSTGTFRTVTVMRPI
jgi:hypothetical protein